MPAPLSNTLRKAIASLSEAKHRRSLMLFKAEGTKCVADTIGTFSLQHLFATHQWLEANPQFSELEQTQCVTKADIERMSSLTTPQQVIAVYELPQWEFDYNCCRENLVLALDTIQDPGNLGTIIRVADWMGIETIICSAETTDCFSPKVIQATMGAISRVRLIYGPLTEMIKQMQPDNVWGTFLEGADINTQPLGSSGVIVIGNEGRGISQQVAGLVTHRITIPSYPPNRSTSESLNAAIATAITLAAFRRI